MGVVEKGNKIQVQASQLTANEVTIQWQQNLRQRSQQYYTAPFINKSQNNEEGVIFIQKDYVDSFKGKKNGEEDFTVEVDGSFQYGQNKEKTKRWLAYHDKNMNAYQWRFVASAAQKFGNGLGNFAGGFLRQYVGIDLGALAGFLGDPLRNF